jgi:hypothetical protein
MSFGLRFLACPELFPARLAGEAWGDREVGLSLGGAAFRFTGLSLEQRELALTRFAGFEDSGPDAASAAVESAVFRVTPAEFLEIDTRGWDYDLDLDADEQQVRMVGMGFMARIEWRPRLRGALWTAAGAETFPGVLENYLRVLTAYRLLEDGAALVHSAGLIDAGEAWLFVGVSGAGKTTLSQLSLAEGRGVLSDDLNVLAPGGEGPRALPLPFAGDLRAKAAAGAFPVRGIVRLRKGPEHALLPLRRAEAVATLAACAPYVNRDPYRSDRLLHNLASLLVGPETHELTFAPRTGFWDLLTGGAP